jgi:hypothetical protein
MEVTVASRRAGKTQALRARQDAALLTALGLDPAEHTIEPRLRPFKGLQIYDKAHRPVRFVTERSLRKPAIRKAWTAALRAAA